MTDLPWKKDTAKEIVDQETLSDMRSELQNIQLEFIKQYIKANPDRQLDIENIKSYLDIGFDRDIIIEKMQNYNLFKPWLEPPVVAETTSDFKFLKYNKEKSEELTEKYNKIFWGENINPNNEDFIKKDVTALDVPEVESFIPIDPDKSLNLSDNIPKKKNKNKSQNKNKSKKESVEEARLKQERKEAELLRLANEIPMEDFEDE